MNRKNPLIISLHTYRDSAASPLLREDLAWRTKALRACNLYREFCDQGEAAQRRSALTFCAPIMSESFFLAGNKYGNNRLRANVSG